MSEDEGRPEPPAPSAAQRKRAQQQAIYRRRRAAALVIALVVLAGGGIAIAALSGGGGTNPTAAAGSTGKGAKGATSGPSTGASSGTGGSSAAGGSTAAASTDATTQRETPTGPPISIGWAGDSIPASDRFGLPDDPGSLLAGVASLLKKPDLMVVNLEGTLTTRGDSKCGGGDSANCYAFRAPPAYAKRVFKDAGVDAVNLANNHANDYGAVGLRDTRSSLRNAGIAFTGAPGQVTVVDVNGVKVGLVGFAPYTWAAPLNDDAAIAKLVKQAVAKADIVVAIMHAGAEGAGATHVPRGHEQAFGEDRGDARTVAHVAIDSGADLVVGSGPHVLRGMEFYKGHLVAYSLGNLVGYGGAFATGGTLSLSAILRVTLKPDGTWVSGTIDPLLLTDQGIPQPDPAEAAHGLVRSLSKDDFGKTAIKLATNGSISPP